MCAISQLGNNTFLGVLEMQRSRHAYCRLGRPRLVWGKNVLCVGEVQVVERDVLDLLPFFGSPGDAHKLLQYGSHYTKIGSVLTYIRIII